MARNTEVISVSIMKDQLAFIDNQNLSASELIQEKIIEQMKLWQTYHGNIEKLQTAKEYLEHELQMIHEFLDLNMLEESWNKWRGERVLEKDR